MQVSLDRIEFYEPDPKAPNLPRLSTLAIPRNEVLSAPDERAEQPRLCGKDPTWEGVIVISDNDGSDGESSSDGDARSSTSRPRPEKQASLPNGCVSPRTISKFPVGPIFDRVNHLLVDANLQPAEKLRADAASSYDRGFPLMQCTLQTPSSSPQQTLFPAPGAPAFEDDTNMQRTQSPSMPLSGTAYDTLHLLSRHAGSLPHSSGNTSRGSSVEPDIEAQERWLLPSPSDRQVLDQIIDGTADKGGPCHATAVDTNEGMPALASSLPVSSLVSHLSPSMCVGLQLVQPNSQDTRRAQEDTISPCTTGNTFYDLEDSVTSTGPSPCGTSPVSTPTTIPRLQARTHDPISPLRLRRTRSARPTHSTPQRYSARLRAISRNALGARFQHKANHDSDSNDGSSSEDGSDNDTSYTTRSINCIEERSNDGLDGDVMPAPKRRKSSSPQVVAAQRRTLRQASRLSAAGANTCATGNARTRGIATPSSSSHQSSDRDSVTDRSVARFEEWPLQDVALKRVTVNGVATFQLQFSWDRRADHRRDHRITETRDPWCSARKRHKKKHASSSGRPFTKDEDHCLMRLKEEDERLSWTKIHELFTKSYPGRTKGSLQVHYCIHQTQRKV